MRLIWSSSKSLGILIWSGLVFIRSTINDCLPSSDNASNVLNVLIISRGLSKSKYHNLNPRKDSVFKIVEPEHINLQ